MNKTVNMMIYIDLYIKNKLNAFKIPIIDNSLLKKQDI